MVKLSDILSRFRKKSRGNMSDWVIAMQRSGLESLAQQFYTRKMEDFNRLRDSGLPVFDSLDIPYSQFCEGSVALDDFLKKYPSVAIRAIPDTKGLPRRHKIGVRTYDNCRKFLKEHIPFWAPWRKNHYTVLLTEHEPTEWSGIIISRGSDAMIGVARGGLDKLSHAEINPDCEGVLAYHNSLYNSLRYTTEDTSARELIWRSIQYIRQPAVSESENFPAVELMKGYFEFLVTKRNSRLVFLDYKINQAYLTSVQTPEKRDWKNRTSD